MRKYLFFVIISVFFSIFFLIAPSISFADPGDITVKAGEHCGTDTVVIPGSTTASITKYICGTGYTCDKKSSTCLQTNASGQVANTKCVCKNPGDASDQKNEIDCPGMKDPIYCGKNTACSTSNDSTVDTGSVNFNGHDSEYAGKALTGVMCSDKKSGNATCQCTGNGTSGQNTFSCTLDSDTKQTGGGSCGSAQDQCQAAPGQAVDTSTLGSYTGFLSKSGILNNGYTVTGIVCRRPAAVCTCDNSGSAEDGQNGFTCTQFGQTQKDFCDPAGSICNTASGSAIQGGEQTKSKIFSGAPLQNIQCTNPELSAIPTLPPPPSPPCKQWNNGECKTFGSALGDLATDPAGFVSTIFAILLSFSGGIALLLIIRSGYQLLTSQGKPEQIQQGRDQLVAAIVGLVFLIFAFVVLETIGVDILHLPGFTGTK